MSEQYDVAIIGAGISGLVAGNYLAKNGFKTLLVEQHSALGGCCSYFLRKGFVFDSGAHSLGSFRPGGQFSRVFKDLGITGISVKRAAVTDTVIVRDFEVNFSGDVAQFIEELLKLFPSERDTLKSFFLEINSFDINSTTSFARYHTKYEGFTFRNVLDNFFSDEELKKVLCIFLGNIGLPSNVVAALPAITMYKEFVLDGGYYVVGGMRKLADTLSENFRNNGGMILTKKKVTKICEKNLSVTGVEVSGGEFISSRSVLSTASTRQTFTKLLDSTSLPSALLEIVNNSKPSISCVIAFLGLNGPSPHKEKWGRTVWYVPNNNADEVYSKLYNNKLDEDAEVVVITFPSAYDDTLAPSGCATMTVILGASFQNREFWKQNKQIVFERMIDRVSLLFPGIQNKIIVSEVGSPATMQRYTLNDEGAMYGLAATIKQSRYNMLPGRTFMNGLYLAGQWTTLSAGQSGTPAAAHAGRRIAKIITADLSKNRFIPSSSTACETGSNKNDRAN